jgi:hypothetical protein
MLVKEADVYIKKQEERKNKERFFFNAIMQCIYLRGGGT